MPITKRLLYDASLYGPADLYEESPQEHLLEDIAMSQTLGAIHQIRILAMFTVEVTNKEKREEEEEEEKKKIIYSLILYL